MYPTINFTICQSRECLRSEHAAGSNGLFHSNELDLFSSLFISLPAGQVYAPTAEKEGMQ